MSGRSLLEPRKAAPQRRSSRRSRVERDSAITPCEDSPNAASTTTRTTFLIWNPCLNFLVLYPTGGTSSCQTNGEPLNGRALCSPMPQESQIESCKDQDDSHVADQPFQEPMPEEQDIHADYDGYHQRHEKPDNRLSMHSQPPFQPDHSTKPRNLGLLGVTSRCSPIAPS